MKNIRILIGLTIAALIILSIATLGFKPSNSDSKASMASFSGVITSTENPITLTMTDTNISVVAVFETVTYSITYTLNGGTHSGNPATFTVADLNIDLQDATRYGFDFLGWYTTSDFYGSPVTQLTTIGDVNLYARWSDPLVANIIYNNLRDTDIYTNLAIFYASDLPIILTDVSRNGWTFQGWYQDSGFTQPITQITSFGDIEVYARLTINEFTIIFENLNGATNPNPSVFTIDSETCDLADPGIRNGWTFAGWWTAEGGMERLWTSAPIGDIGSQTLYAYWTLNEYLINFNNLQGGTHANISSFNVGTSTITLASASRTGYRFDGWWTGLEGGTQITQIDEGSFGDLTVYARWSIDFSDDETGITVGQGPGGEIVVTVPGDPGTVITINPDNNPAVTIVPPNGDIIVDGPSQDGEITITIPGDYDDEETIIIVRPGEDPPVTVIPPAVRFTVTFDSLGGTPVNFQRIIQGEQAVKPTSTRTLYRLLGWSHNGEIFNFATSITEAKTLYAVWERINIDDGDTGIVVNPGDDGEIVITIPGEGGEEDTIIIIRPDPDNDEEHKVIITPPSGDITVEDDGDGKITITIPGEGDEEEVIIIVRPDEDPPVIIYPPVIRFTVVFDPLGGTAVPSQRVIKGEQATRSTSTRMLYRLLGWSHDGEVFDFETPITQAKTLSAIWQRIDIDTGDTGIIIQPGDEDDNDLPGDNDDIVIIIPGAPDTIIIVRPEDSDPVNIYPPNDDIVVEDDDDKEITITIPGNYDDEYVIITVRPDEDPPVTIQESTPHFTISFNSECEIEIPSQRVVINMPAVMPTPTRTLHRLVGWSTQENGENREIFDFSTPITSAQAFHAVWERILIDDGGTGIIVKPGDSEDGENPGQDDDIVIIIPDDDEAIVIIIRPDPENDGEYKVVISPPNADIEVEGGEDGEIIITVPGEDDGGCTVIIVRPGEDPPVVIIPPNTDTNQGGDDNGNFFTNNWPWFVAGFCIISLLILIGWIIHKSRRKNNSNL